MMFFETLTGGHPRAGQIDLETELGKQTWDQYLKLVELIPSCALKAYFLARLALARWYGKADKSTFDSLMQDHVLAELQFLPDFEVRNRVIAGTAGAIYEYSSE